MVSVCCILCNVARETDRLRAHSRGCYVRQVEFANVILINKVDLVRAEELAQLEHILRALNPGARVLKVGGALWICRQLGCNFNDNKRAPIASVTLMPAC